MNTSDAFDDDSFFSESILLSTQALEEEAIGCNPTPSKKMKNETKKHFCQRRMVGWLDGICLHKW